MATSKELIDILIQAATITKNKAKTNKNENPIIVEAEIKAEAIKKFFSQPVIVEHNSLDDGDDILLPQPPVPFNRQ